MTQDLVPKWGTFMFKGMTGGLPNHSDVKNALLYSDVVALMPFNCVYSEGMVVGFNSTKPPRQIQKEVPPTPHVTMAESIIASYKELYRGIENSGLSKVLVMPYAPGTLIEQNLDKPRIEINSDFSKIAQYAQVFVTDAPASQETPRWDPYIATESFTKAVTKIFLPDVGIMPIEAIAEMREKLSDYLDPMRAELLRLTEDLRKVIADQCNARQISLEAENLIKTRVEPIVREAGQKATEMMERKWRRFYQGIARVFGLTGAAFFRPDLLTDALKEVLNTSVALSDNSDQKEPFGKTARFVLEARRLILAQRE